MFLMERRSRSTLIIMIIIIFINAFCHGEDRRIKSVFDNQSCGVTTVQQLKRKEYFDRMQKLSCRHSE